MRRTRLNSTCEPVESEVGEEKKTQANRVQLFAMLSMFTERRSEVVHGNGSGLVSYSAFESLNKKFM